jgi:hypothetical protein
MFDERHYVPILKGKEGEFRALAEMYAADKARLTPLIEVAPVTWDYVNEQPAKTVEAHLEPLSRKLLNSWGDKRPLFLDVETLNEDTAGGMHPLEFILTRTRAAGVQVIPVTGLNRAAPTQTAVAQAAAQDGNGVCIRLLPTDIAQGNLATSLPALLQTLDVSEEHVDIVIDYEAIASGHAALLPVLMQAHVGLLPQVHDWRTLTIAATAFPQDLTDVGPASAATIDRVEWQVWTAARGLPIPRRPSFGDYAISHPEMNEMDPRMLKMSAAIRYTTPDEWLVLKGRNVRDHGFVQFHTLAATLIQRPEYAGQTFSWGDDYIWNCAHSQCGPGNATTWRQVGTNHHMTCVTTQIANLP